MPANAAENPQTSLYETTIENAELEALLEKRDELKTKAAGARKRFEAVDVEAREAIEKLDIADAPVRIGKYVVKVVQTSTRTVESFEVAGGSRLKISPLPLDAQ